MNSTSSSYDLNLSTGTIPMSETIVDDHSNQPLVTTNDIDQITEDKHLLSNQDNMLSSTPTETIPFESSPTNITQKQKSLISVYDNSNDGEQQQINQNSLPLVGILGHNRRSHAFAKRLILSGFPKPILCDMNTHQIDSTNQLNYINLENFLHQSPSIILITEYFQTNLEHFFDLPKHPLIIDARELHSSKKSQHFLLSIPDCYQAFGNLSDWEIENGTQRVAVLIEQTSPRNLLKFIENLKCFSSGLYFVDQYTYNHERMKSFRNCLFPFLMTLIILCLSIIFSSIEYRNNREKSYLFRQASSITASTSITLLSVLFLIRPLIEIVDFIYQKCLHHEHILLHWKFLQGWLQSRRYFAWYSLSFAFLHFIFLLLSRTNFHENIYFYPIFLGLITLIILFVLSCTFFPWISQHLVWREYHFLTSHVGSCSLIFAFLHVFFHWKYDYYYYNFNHEKDLFQLKFLSTFLPMIVLLIRFILYGIVRPIQKIVLQQPRKTPSTVLP